MPFTDAQLAAQISAELVNSGVMTAAEQAQLLANPIEVNVRTTLTPVQIANFGAYWVALDAWITANGGNTAITTGRNVPGRVGGNPVNIGDISIYNDVIPDVLRHMNNPGFSVVK